MDKEIKSISEVQDAETEAKKTVERALSQKQKHIDDANKKAREIVEGAEQESKVEMQKAIDATTKELESMKADEARATKKMSDQIRSRKLSKTGIQRIAADIARAIAGE
ncbi:MAG: hypothetical protein KGH52_02700 [Candidatus Micrarchaeota archaeon]|nr:hypothetical protein [Candidatus Micrarchaeota archaeon]